MKQFALKALPFAIISSIVTTVAIIVVNMIGDVSALEPRVGENSKKIQSVEKKINQIHWYLIKKNNVEVPGDIQ